MHKCGFTQNQVNSKLPAVSESVLKQLEDRFRETKEQQFSDKDLLSLHSVFGSVLQRAFDILEKHSTLTAYVTVNKFRTLIEIKGEDDRCYRVFPKINFCPCRAFKHQVLEKKIQVTCKHVLAARLAQILSTVEEHVVTPDQYLMLVQSMFDLEQHG